MQSSLRRKAEELHLKSLPITLMLALSVPVTTPSTLWAQELPVPDGVYLRDQTQCAELQKGTLEFIDIEITNGGRSLGFPEASCQVAKTNEIRPGRFHLVADCLEFGDVSMYDGFVDVVSNAEIRLDGESHYLCNGVAGEQSSTSAQSSDIEAAIERWAGEDDQCRGGLGNDPATYEACERREAASAQLTEMGMCYGRETELGHEHEWHVCEEGSIR
jgi:hypothetical protein